MTTQNAKHGSCFVCPPPTPEYSRAAHCVPALTCVASSSLLSVSVRGPRGREEEPKTREVREPPKPIPARARCPHKLLVWLL